MSLNFVRVESLFEPRCPNFFCAYNNSYPISMDKVIDLDILNEQFTLALFSMSLNLFTSSDGLLLHQYNLEIPAISLGRYGKSFVVTCESNSLYFFAIFESMLIMYRQVETEVQFSNAWSIVPDCLVCVAEREAKIYFLNYNMECTSIHELRDYGVNITHERSSRHVRLTRNGYACISDYENHYICVISRFGEQVSIYDVEYPKNLAIDRGDIYAVQGGSRTQVLKINQLGKTCLLDLSYEITSPTCVSRVFNGYILVGAKRILTYARIFRFPTRYYDTFEFNQPRRRHG